MSFSVSLSSKNSPTITPDTMPTNGVAAALATSLRSTLKSCPLPWPPRIRCAELETGRNSVRPWMKARTMICSSVTAAGPGAVEANWELADLDGTELRLEARLENV